MNRRNLSAALVACLSLSALPGCNSGEASEPEIAAETALPVAVVNAERGDIQATYSTTGNLTADAEAPIPARIEGVITSIKVEEGDRVRRGDVLATLDGGRARLEMLKAGAEYERRQREFERFSNLHARGLVSSAARDAAEYDVASGKAAHDMAALDYEYTHIRATIDGVVSARDVKIGQTLREGDVAFTVTDSTLLVAYLDIPQVELAKFSPGHASVLTVDSHPGERFAASVLRVSPTIDRESGTFRATMAVDNSAGELAPGMFGRFTVAWQNRRDVLVIPEAALIDEDGETSVYVVENGEAIRRVVQTGIRAGGRVEILEGLTAEDRIVLNGQSRIRDGSRVLAEAAKHHEKPRRG